MQREKASVFQDLSVKLESIDETSVPCDNLGSIGRKAPNKLPGRDSTHKTHRGLRDDDDRMSSKDTNALLTGTDVKKDIFQAVSDVNICEPVRHSSKQYAPKKCAPRSSSSTECALATENTKQSMQNNRNLKPKE